MPTLNEISNADATYQGNPVLGGASGEALNINTNPLFQLSYYTAMYNKNLYDQSITDRDAKIANIAKISQIDLNNLYGKDKDQIIGKLDDLKSFATEYAKSDNRSINQELEYQDKLAAVDNDYNSGKARSALYHSQINDVLGSEMPPAEKDERIKQITNRFNSTDISTELPSQSAYTPVVIKIPDPPTLPISVVKIGDNANLTTKGTIFNANQAAQDINLKLSGLSHLNEPLKSGASQTERDAYNLQQTADQEVQNAIDTTKVFNSILTAKNTDGSFKYFSGDNNSQFNEGDFIRDNSSNTAVMQAYNGMKNSTAYNKNLLNQLNTGTFTDGKFNFNVPNNLSQAVIQPGIIDITSEGVKPSQLLMGQVFNKYQGDKFEKTLEKTGYQNELEKERMAQSGENYRKGLEIVKDKYIANLPYDKQKAGAVGADGKPIDFGNLINGINSEPNKFIEIDKTDGTKVSGVKVNNGVIVDKQGNVVDYTGDLKIPANYLDNSIVTEFNKYAGSTKTDAQGNTVSNPATKLLIENGKYTVRMVNGQIQGIQTENPDEGSPDKGGAFATADEFQHITMVAGQKGVTKYKKPDVNIGKFDNSKQPPLTQAQKYMQSLNK